MNTPPDRRAVGRRARRIGVLAVATGAMTGLLVAGFDRLTRSGLFAVVLRAPLWVQAVAPGAGLVIAAVCLRTLARGASPSTADDYIRVFHDADARMDLTVVPGRLAASAATLGAGAAMGFEGPAIYLGAAVGSFLQRRLGRLVTRGDAKVLLVCGAAAGVAAIFKAPATGLVFALEVPYRQDLARRMLLPAMFSSAVSYVAFVAINGTTPLFPMGGSPAFDARDLAGAAVLGLLCGLGARVFVAALGWAKHAAATTSVTLRLAVSTGLLVGAFVVARALTGESLTIGSGYEAIGWSLEPAHAAALILAIFLLRGTATVLAVLGGGVGGLFVPLVTQGALLGSALAVVVHPADAALFPLLGVAAFLGAGYRVPLAAVMFVAETTGRPGFVVPGLIAAATSQLLMGRFSASTYQQDMRTGLLERRLGLPVTAALRTDATTVPPDATVAELHAHHIGELRLRIVPVVDGATFRGMVLLEDAVQLPSEEWSTTPIARIMQSEWPQGQLTWTLGDAVTAMQQADIDRLPILDDGAFVGMVTTGEILKLDAILNRAEGGH